MSRSPKAKKPRSPKAKKRRQALDVYEPYAWRDWLESEIPLGVPRVKRMIYIGIGTDVWVPFGILDAIDVTAYDMVDFVYVPVGKSKRERLYGYAYELAKQIRAMGPETRKITYNEPRNSFTIHFAYNGKKRTLTLFIGNANRVAQFPEADLIYNAGDIAPSTRQRAIRQSHAAYWMDQNTESPTFELRYPSSMDKLQEIWLFLTNLTFALKEPCKSQVWDAVLDPEALEGPITSLEPMRLEQLG